MLSQNSSSSSSSSISTLSSLLDNYLDNGDIQAINDAIALLKPPIRAKHLDIFLEKTQLANTESLLKSSADMSNPRDVRKLALFGLAFYVGIGVQQDLNKAAVAFKKATELHEPLAGSYISQLASFFYQSRYFLDAFECFEVGIRSHNKTIRGQTFYNLQHLATETHHMVPDNLVRLYELTLKSDDEKCRHTTYESLIHQADIYMQNKLYEFESASSYSEGYFKYGIECYSLALISNIDSFKETALTKLTKISKKTYNDKSIALLAQLTLFEYYLTIKRPNHKEQLTKINIEKWLMSFSSDGKEYVEIANHMADATFAETGDIILKLQRLAASDNILFALNAEIKLAKFLCAQETQATLDMAVSIYASAHKKAHWYRHYYIRHKIISELKELNKTDNATLLKTLAICQLREDEFYKRHLCAMTEARSKLANQYLSDALKLFEKQLQSALLQNDKPVIRSLQMELLALQHDLKDDDHKENVQQVLDCLNTPAPQVMNSVTDPASTVSSSTQVLRMLSPTSHDTDAPVFSSASAPTPLSTTPMSVLPPAFNPAVTASHEIPDVATTPSAPSIQAGNVNDDALKDFLNLPVPQHSLFSATQRVDAPLAEKKDRAEELRLILG